MADDLVSSLRQLAAQNPRLARDKFEELLGGDPALLDIILTRIAAPGEGRLRQLVANFARSRGEQDRFKEHFQQWLNIETDEFARRAIASALTAGPVLRSQPAVRRLADANLVEMFRYVSERLRHELQNALLGPQARLLQLGTKIRRIDESITRGELEALVAQLRDEFQTLGQMAEFEPNDTYFALRPTNICQWIEQMNRDYAKRYRRIDLQIQETGDIPHQVLASDYLLRLIFWNLWINAQQAVGDPCRITLVCEVTDEKLVILVRDNGAGFPAEMSEIAFRDRYSHTGPNRGRGLLEIQDAIQQLHGEAELIELSSRDYRVSLSFPIHTA
jgi:signal transduction histidine kinase